MSRWKIIREWLNKNDGAHFQVENDDLKALEVSGYLTVIAALIIFLIDSKAGIDETWLGWLCLIMGIVAILIGAIIRIKNNKNT